VGGYIVTRSGRNLRVKWRSREPDGPPYEDTHVRFTLRYTAHGALTHPPGGHELYWKTIFPDRSSSIRQVHVRIVLPEALPDDADVRAQLYAFTEGSTIERIDARTLLVSATDVPPSEDLEVRIRFPRCGLPETASLRRVFNERWVYVVLAVIPLLTGLLMLAHFMACGRDKPTPGYAVHVTSPPSDLSPALAGVLVDERAGMAEVLSIIIDLASRGYLRIHEQVAGGGLKKNRETTLTLLKAPDDLRACEQAALSGMRLAVPGDSVTLSSLRDDFSSTATSLQMQLYGELVEEGYFERSPEVTRGDYAGYALATGLIVLALLIDPALLSLPWRIACHIMAAILALLAWAAVAQRQGGALGWLGAISFTLFAVSLSPGAVLRILSWEWVMACATLAGIIVAAFAPLMPAKTLKGSIESRKWHAFRDYLRNISRYPGLAEAQSVLDRYMPYAVAFGIERDFLAQLRRTSGQTLLHGPDWYMVSHYAGDADMQTAQPTDTTIGALPSLDTITDSLFSTLQTAVTVAEAAGAEVEEVAAGRHPAQATRGRTRTGRDGW